MTDDELLKMIKTAPLVVFLDEEHLITAAYGDGRPLKRQANLMKDPQTLTDVQAIDSVHVIKKHNPGRCVHDRRCNIWCP